MKKITLLSILFLSLPYAASAASAHIMQMPQEAGVGDTIAVSLSVDTSTPINAFSGSLHYAQDKLELIKVSDGNSVVGLWVTRPHDEKGDILFDALVPGGYAGTGGLLFTALFRAKEAGTAAVSLNRAMFLRNDGAGSAEEVSSKALVVAIAARPSGGFVETIDTDLPEPFAIQLGVSADLFSGRPYAVFSTSDKGSGVNYYEVAERRIPSGSLLWQRAVSPYVLEDRYGTSDLYVRAVDNAGNGQVAAYPRTHVLRPYELLILGILLVVLFIYVKRGI